jgi:hypothetical protein
MNEKEKEHFLKIEKKIFFKYIHFNDILIYLFFFFYDLYIFQPEFKISIFSYKIYLYFFFSSYNNYYSDL